MADPLAPPPHQPPTANHNHITTLLNALTSIDQRLSRIETALRLTNSYNHAPPPVPAPHPHGVVTVQQQQQHGLNQHHQQQQQQHQQQQQQLATQTVLALNPANGPAVIGPVVFRPLEPPPQGMTISSRASMQEELDQWTIPRGYSMRIAGAKVSGKKKVRWVCFRGGEARHHRAPVDESVILQAKAEGRRKPTTDRTSKKCGCMFRFEVVETTKGSDVWSLHYPNEEHKVDQWLRDGWLVSKIQEELKSRGFTNVLNTDLYNRKRLLKKDETSIME
ncbi:hypothetical protein B0H66DRAFT_251476 [Apodospora peruviana]|uniref:Uncharacterized protein n=1 Tax=Apodospora peruviana TaxID=516989 RepID=A0AAE0I5T7_9PEZI|nr:hypothetical protein B0H66DRAFT_104569 [Apodospora peruviana]KAK3318854.1 hypothetical protein B0H66DRAFT_251476 [Apodospora peruviana]